MILDRLFALALSLALALAPVRAWSTQAALIPPTTGVYSGVQFSTLLGQAFQSLASCNSGTSAPANINGTNIEGLCWIDTSVSPHLKKRYTGSVWVVEGALDDANGLWSPPIGAGKGSLASAATVDLGSVPQSYIEITGAVTIASFGSSAPIYSSKIVKFLSAPKLTYSSALPVPGGYDLTVDANARAMVTHLGSGNWEFQYLSRASGVAIDAARLCKIEFNVTGTLPANAVYGYGQALTRTSYPAFLACATSVQTANRTSGSNILTGFASTAGFAVGKPLEGTGIPASTTISSVDSSSQIHISNNATSGSGTPTSITVFLTGYGSGGSSTTIGVPDCQGRMLAGRDDLSGTPQNRITNAGSGIVGTGLGNSGGNQSVALDVNNLPAHTHPITDPGHIHLITETAHFHGMDYGNTSILYAPGGNSATVVGTLNAPGGGPFAQSTRSVSTGISINNHSTGITQADNNTTTSAAVNKMPPVLVANCVVYVQP